MDEPTPAEDGGAPPVQLATVINHEHPGLVAYVATFPGNHHSYAVYLAGPHGPELDVDGAPVTSGQVTYGTQQEVCQRLHRKLPEYAYATRGR